MVVEGDDRYISYLFFFSRIGGSQPIDTRAAHAQAQLAKFNPCPYLSLLSLAHTSLHDIRSTTTCMHENKIIKKKKGLLYERVGDL